MIEFPDICLSYSSVYILSFSMIDQFIQKIRKIELGSPGTNYRLTLQLRAELFSIVFCFLIFKDVYVKNRWYPNKPN